MTLCNMSIEAGGRCGMVAPDETTFAYLKGRPYAPKGELFEQARGGVVDARHRSRRRVRPRGHARCRGDRADRHLGHDAGRRAADRRHAPDPARERDPVRAKYLRDALDYMGIAPGKKLTDIAIDRVFIGSCTNARIEDLRAAAAVLAGRTAKVPGLVSPGSSMVKRQAEEEGLDRIFRDAGLEWADFGLLDVRRHQRRSCRRRASAAPRPPTAISAAGRAQARARI